MLLSAVTGSLQSMTDGNNPDSAATSPHSTSCMSLQPTAENDGLESIASFQSIAVFDELATGDNDPEPAAAISCSTSPILLPTAGNDGLECIIPSPSTTVSESTSLLSYYFGRRSPARLKTFRYHGESKIY